MIDLSKLRIVDGFIFYRIRQQDGSFQEMCCRDTTTNRLIVSWIQIHD
jgi:hypothetical protein